MDSLRYDVRLAFRSFCKSPVVAVVLVLTTALALGANAAIFGVINQVLLRPLGISHPDQLVMLWPRNLSQNIPMDLATPDLYEDWRSENHVFSEMAAATDQMYTLTGSGEPGSLVAWRISHNFMHVLGAKPVLGRTFAADEDQPGHDHVVLLSDKLWHRRFGGDPSILGKTIVLNDAPYMVIGIMPRGFNFPSDVDDIWTPLALPSGMRSDRTATILRVLARIREGVTVKQAQADMEQLSLRLAQRHPGTDHGWDVLFQPVRDFLVGDIRAPLLVLMGAVSFVLMIACANIANLLLARATGRRKEFAVSIALGATRLRVVRQLLTESMLLALLGSILGLVLASWATRLLLQLFPNNIANVFIPRIERIPMDRVVVGFSLLLAIVTGIVFGSAPALGACSVSPGESLKQNSPGSIGGARSPRLRSLLVLAQICLALVLLVCAGLMIKSFVRLENANLGFNPNHILTLQVDLPTSRYKTDPERSRFVRQALARIGALPGVESAGAVNYLPLSGFWGTLSFTPLSNRSLPVAQWPKADYRIASEDYFRTLEIPVLRGRTFTAQDSAESQPVCVINQALARAFFPQQDPAGRFLTPDPGLGNKPWLIVGVVGDVKHFGAAEPAHPEVYRPFTEDGFPLIAFAVRTHTQPTALADSVRHAIWNIDKDQAIFRVLTMEEAVSESSALRRISTGIFAFFAAAALALATLGIYGVVSYFSVERTREVGIRMALGARPDDILLMILGQSLRLAAIGLVLGIAAAWASSRLLGNLLFEVHALDPFIFTSVPALLCLIAVLAAWLPARRAARLDPMNALRYE